MRLKIVAIIDQNTHGFALDRPHLCRIIAVMRRFTDHAHKYFLHDEAKGVFGGEFGNIAIFIPTAFITKPRAGDWAYLALNGYGYPQWGRTQA
jgi:hypothetical protein